MKKIQIGVFGVSDASGEQMKLAEEVGREIASRGWVLINGGLSGVMEAASKGAASNNGIVVGILPTKSASDANEYVSIPVVTNMGHARNAIIAHSADACIAIGRGYGTLSEIAIALKEGRLVVSLDSWEVDGVVKADSPGKAISILESKMG